MAYLFSLATLPSMDSSQNAGNFTIDGNADKVGVVFCAPITGDIDRVGVYCSSVTGTVTNKLAVAIETVTNGMPSGTDVGSSAEGVFTPAASTFHQVSLATKAAVTAGTLYAAVVKVADGADITTPASTAVFRDMIGPVAGSQHKSSLPFPVRNSTGSWAHINNAAPSAICPRYEDSDGGEIIWGCHGITALVTNVAYNSTDTPDEIGMQFTVPYDCTCTGIEAAPYLVSGLTGNLINLVLYDGTSVLKSLTIVGEMIQGSGQTRLYYPFAPVDLTADTPYIVAIQCVHTTDHFYPVVATYADTAHRAAAWGTMQKITRTDAGSWSAVVATDAIPIRPIIGSISVGGTAGMKRVAGMLGGLRG